MSTESVKAKSHRKRSLSTMKGLPQKRRTVYRPTAARSSTERPGTIIYLECLDLDLLSQVCQRLERWSRARGWKVTNSFVTLHPENRAPSSARFPFHDPLAWPVLGREADWIEAHRRDVDNFGEPPAGTLHLQCSGWVRTLACLKARGLAPQAEILESVGAELPCPNHTFMLVGPFSKMRSSAYPASEPECVWSLLGRAFERKVADEMEAAAVRLLGARVVEGNPGWSAAHYGLQIESMLARHLDS